ncbi:hypothetical protein ACFLZG_07625, partial [Thermodesulfobacteriota bacterium]
NIDTDPFSDNDLVTIRVIHKQDRWEISDADGNAYIIETNASNPDFLNVYGVASGGRYYVNIPRGPPQIDGSLGTAGPYIVISGAGKLTIAEVFILEGAFRFELSVDRLQLQVAARLKLGPLGEVKAFGFLEINDQGLIGVIRLDASFPGLKEIGIEFAAYANFVLNTTSQDTPITIMFGPGDSETFLIPKATLQIQIAGKLIFKAGKDGDELFRMSGVFLLEINNEGLSMFVDAALVIGPPDVNIFDFHAVGVMIINSEGFAADISVSMSIGQGSVLEDFFSVSLSARIILNTTGQEQGFQIPDRFLEFLDPDTISLLDADNRMVVRAGAPKPDGTYEPPGPYVFIQASGSLTIINVFKIEAAFRLKFSTVGLDLAFSGSLRLDPLGSLEAAGNLEIDSRGVIARVALSLDAGFGGDVGISFSGDALLEVNTTGQDQTIYLANGDQVVVGEGVRVYIAGSVEFLGFASASGSVTITVNSNQLTLEFDVTIVLGPFSLEVRGGAGVYYGSDPGLALLLDVSLDVNIFEIFKIQASGKLHLNTSKNTTRVLSGISLAPASFRLELHGLIKILEVLKFEAGFTIQVGAGEFEVGSALYGTNNTLIQDTGDWYFEFYASMDFFGLATLDANGWLNSKGHFDIFVAGELVLGTRSFGLVGDFAFHIYLNQGPDFPYYYRFGVTADASVSIRAFGISFASVGIGFSLTAEGAGLVPLVAKAYASIKILFIKISVSMSFTLGYIELPKPVFLAGDATGDTRQWTQSALDGGTGELHLNMGSRNSIRGIGAGAADESYIIEHMSGDADGETVKVIFSGRETIYKGVTKIVADAGDGADQILVREGVLVPVEFHGGPGGDALLHEGSGHAELFGDSGVDYIETGTFSTTAL